MHVIILRKPWYGKFSELAPTKGKLYICLLYDIYIYIYILYTHIFIYFSQLSYERYSYT